MMLHYTTVDSQVEAHNWPYEVSQGGRKCH